jgi:hypothetical protein
VFCLPSPRYPTYHSRHFQHSHHAPSWNSWCSLRRMIFAVAIGACGIFIYLIWFGMNSDRDNIPPLLTQLIHLLHFNAPTASPVSPHHRHRNQNILQLGVSSTDETTRT